MPFRAEEQPGVAPGASGSLHHVGPACYTWARPGTLKRPGPLTQAPFSEAPMPDSDGSTQVRRCLFCDAAMTPKPYEDNYRFRHRTYCGRRCAGTHQRQREVAERAPIKRQLDEARFWSKVDKSSGPDGCWLWTGSRISTGYGNVYYLGSMVLAHRLSLMLSGVDVQPSVFVCHKCDNPPCCNPAHLFLGTNADNVADMISKDRHSRGERNGHAKLSPESVSEIRRLRSDGATEIELSARFGVSRATISDISRRRSWTHI